VRIDNQVPTKNWRRPGWKAQCALNSALPAELICGSRGYRRVSGFCVTLPDKKRGRGSQGNRWRGLVSDTDNPIVEPAGSALVAAHVVYGLHSFAIVLGIVGSATVIGGFLGSLPSIIAVILSYVKRGDATGSWAESHFRWQIRTFWFALLWLIIAVLLIVTLLGAPLGFAMLITVTVWLIYRIARGWIRLLGKQPMYV
jgi:uncharacterized membrane protein